MNLINEVISIEEEINETQAIFNESNSAVDDLETVENLQSVITANISKESIDIARISVEDIHDRLGMKYSEIIISTEGIKETLIRMVENFRRFFLNIWDKIKTFFFRLFDNISKIESKTKDILKKLETIRNVEFKRADIDNSYISHSFGISGDNKPLEFDRVKEIFKNHDQVNQKFIPILKDTMGVRNNVSTITLAIKVQSDLILNNNFAKLKDKIKSFTTEIIRGTTLEERKEDNNGMHVLSRSNDLIASKYISYRIDLRNSAKYVIPKITLTTELLDNSNSSVVKLPNIEELKYICHCVLNLCNHITDFKKLVSDEDKLRIKENESMIRIGTIIGNIKESTGNIDGPVISYLFNTMKFFQAPSIFALGNLNSLNIRACIGGFKYIGLGVSNIVVNEENKDTVNDINSTLLLTN